MNFLERLFKKKILGEKLKELVFNLGYKSNKYLSKLFSPKFEYSSHPYGQLDIESLNNKVLFDLEITPRYNHPLESGKYQNMNYGKRSAIKKTLSYEELAKNPVLKKYVKGKYLEKSLAVISVASILASAFFISNNITGNAILANNANSSGIIGAGLFVFGLVCFFVVKNIE